MKKGLILINLGTPKTCTLWSVYRYLTQFLNDPHVVDLPFFIRWTLVNLLIIPLRVKKSKSAYEKIWQEKGSPLLIQSQELTLALQNHLSDEYQVELAMRYGEPSLKSAIKKLQHCEEIDFIPLFPQYSKAVTGSIIKKIHTLLKDKKQSFEILNQFYDDPGFIQAYAEIIQSTIQSEKIDHLLFSYHGIPEHHLKKMGCHRQCGALDCPHLPENHCYRAQCFATTHSVAKKLGLKNDQFSVTFQSRLGKAAWIKPYTDKVLPELIKKGIKNLAIVCPSFVSDCLETLEEINIRARDQWETLGGEEFIFIPCLNTHTTWVKALTNITKNLKI